MVIVYVNVSFCSLYNLCNTHVLDHIAHILFWMCFKSTLPQPSLSKSYGYWVIGTPLLLSQYSSFNLAGMGLDRYQIIGYSGVSNDICTELRSLGDVLILCLHLDSFSAYSVKRSLTLSLNVGNDHYWSFCFFVS
jgi:hypothetical protein